MKKKKEFGNLIIKTRNEKNLSQAELAKLVHVTRQAISRWENGVSFPDESVLLDLCKVLDIDEKLARVYCDGENVRNFEEILNREKKKLRKKYIIFPCFVCGILLIAFIFTIVIVMNSNSFTVYKLDIDSDDFTLENGILITSKVKNYFQLGTLLANDEDIIIYKVKILMKDNDTLRTILEATYGNSIHFLEDYGYNEYLPNINNIPDNLLMDVVIIKDDEYQTFTLSIKLEKIIENNIGLYVKGESIGNGVTSSNIEEKDSLEENCNLIVQKLKDNGYELDTKSFNYVKTINDGWYIYSLEGNSLYYAISSKNSSINIDYDIDNGFITVTNFNKKKGVHTINFAYYIDEESLNCFSDFCDDYDKYLEIIETEYAKLF